MITHTRSRASADTGEALVRQIAQRLHRRLPDSVELDDLIGAGNVGLITAQRRYDPDKSVPFEAFARLHIRGAIVDSLRQLDWAPRSVRRAQRTLEQERRRFLAHVGREPTPLELANQMRVSHDDLSALQACANVPRWVSLDVPVSGEAGVACRLGDQVAADEPDALARCIRAEARERIRQAIHELPERERVALSLYDLRGLSLREVGQVLGVTESRVCQIRTQAIRRLRRRLRPAH